MTDAGRRPVGEIMVRLLFKSLTKALTFVTLFSLFVGAVAFFGLASLTPTYQGRVMLLIDPGDTPDGVSLANQVQILRSSELARVVADGLDLESNPEYRAAAEGGSLLGWLSATADKLLGRTQSPGRDHVLTAYFQNLEVSAVPHSSVVIIGFSSIDPQFAVRGANAIADEYFDLRRDAPTNPAPVLTAAIADLRDRIAETEEAIKDHRINNAGSGTEGQVAMALRRQRLSDLNAELTRVRSRRSEAEIRIAQIRTGLDAGTLPDNPGILGSREFQRLTRQRGQPTTQVGERVPSQQPDDPDAGEPTATRADLDQQIAIEARAMMDMLKGETTRLRVREAEIERDLTRLSAAIAAADQAQARLDELERKAVSDGELLQTYLLRYREALDRQGVQSEPAEPRIISRASVPTAAHYPRVIPVTAIVMLAAFLLASLAVIARTRTSGGTNGHMSRAKPTPPGPLPSVKQMRRQDLQVDPTFATTVASQRQESVSRISARIASERRRFILVTHADGSNVGDRPPAAAALARALARADHRTVLIDLRGDGVSNAAMAITGDRPGFTDLVAGEACFAEVIARDRQSRTHFVATGRKPCTVEALAGPSAAAILETLTHTYDHVVIDCAHDMIDLLAPRSDISVVVDGLEAGDPRTEPVLRRIVAASQSPVLHLAFEPAVRTPEAANAAAVMKKGKAA
ncbi:MAG: hypothetical protein GY798_24550 [Hyphomicrobiales bacterium]|nr:hypothetical protein [Hyphomicrobiales bacterium]